MTGTFRSIGSIAAGMVRSREFERCTVRPIRAEASGAGSVGIDPAPLFPESASPVGGRRGILGGPHAVGPLSEE